MQALGIVDIGDEPPEADLGLRKRSVLLQIHLLALERLEEAFGLGILVRSAKRRHADPGADSFQPRDIVAAGVLHPTVRMVDQAWSGAPSRQRLLQSRQRQSGVDGPRQVP